MKQDKSGGIRHDSKRMRECFKVPWLSCSSNQLVLGLRKSTSYTLGLDRRLMTNRQVLQQALHSRTVFLLLHIVYRCSIGTLSLRPVLALPCPTSYFSSSESLIVKDLTSFCQLSNILVRATPPYEDFGGDESSPPTSSWIYGLIWGESALELTRENGMCSPQRFALYR